MAINARTKGANGEYEVIGILQPIVDEIFAEFGYIAPTLRRNAMQYADGGEDIANLPWYAVEVKRCEKEDLARWWLQAAREAGSMAVSLGQFDEIEKFEYSGAVSVTRVNKYLDNDLSNIGMRISGNGSREGKEIRHGSVVGLDVAKGWKGPNRKKIPLLFWRRNRHPWRVLLPLVTNVGGSGITPAVNMTIPAEISLDAFIAWLRFDLRGKVGAYWAICHARDLARLPSTSCD